MPPAHLISAVLAIGVAFLAQGSMAVELPTFGPQQPPYKQGTIAIIDGTLIDATGAPPRPHQTVIIKKGRIDSIGPTGKTAIPTDAQRIDAAGMTIMPGLINSNQHLQLNPLYPAPAADLPLDQMQSRWERNYENMDQRAFIYLMQGVTTQRQTSGPFARMRLEKIRIDAKEVPGPRIMLGGALLNSPGNIANKIKVHHMDPEVEQWIRQDFAWYVVNDVDKDTDPLLGKDVNFWKIMFSDEIFNGTNDFTDEQVKFMIDKAHKAGKSVDTHANETPEGYRRLLKFEIQSWEHPFTGKFVIDDDVIEEMARKGVIVDSLLQVRTVGFKRLEDPQRFDEMLYAMSLAPDEYRVLMGYRDKMQFLERNRDYKGIAIYTPRASESAMFGQNGPSYEEQRKAYETSRENMRRFIKHKVKLAMGTDTPAFLNFQQEDSAASEMAAMVELGMTPMEAIQAATRNGAELLNMLVDLGTVESGKIADVIVVAGDPMKSMEAMKRVAYVIKEGIRYK